MVRRRGRGRVEKKLEAVEAKHELIKHRTYRDFATGFEIEELFRGIAEEKHEKPPPRTEADLWRVYQNDLEAARGEGTLDLFRTTPGWQDEESVALLDEWRTQAMERVQRVADGESLRDVYEGGGYADDGPPEAA